MLHPCHLGRMQAAIDLDNGLALLWPTRALRLSVKALGPRQSYRQSPCTRRSCASFPAWKSSATHQSRPRVDFPISHQLDAVARLLERPEVQSATLHTWPARSRRSAYVPKHALAAIGIGLRRGERNAAANENQQEMFHYFFTSRHRVSHAALASESNLYASRSVNSFDARVRRELAYLHRVVRHFSGRCARSSV